jgi:type II secretory pathway component GspD/PulD (secretin)
MLEAKLIEVSISDQETMGIDWAKLAKLGYIVTESGSPIEFVGGAQSGSLIPGLSVSQDENGNIIELLSPETPGLADEIYFQRFSDGAIPFSNGAARQLTQFDVTLDFLLRNNKAEILANSQVVTLNGHEAEISMVDVVPYILSSGGVGGQVKVQREEVGIKLKIIPTVNSDGYITTSVTPEVSSIYDMIGPDRNIPHVKKRVSNTTIRVKDGETIIIAGLLSAGKRRDISKFPLLWRIPYIGEKFFIHTDEIITKTDLIVQITPRIIHDNYSGIDKNENHESAEDNLDN